MSLATTTFSRSLVHAMRPGKAQVAASKKGRSWIIENELSEMNRGTDANIPEEEPQISSKVEETKQEPLQQIPSAAREDVLRQCASATLYFSLGGAILRFWAFPASRILPWANEEAVGNLLQNPLEISHVPLVLALTLFVTTARIILLKTVPDFALASKRSNKLTLGNLNQADLLFVSILPGFSEELLFRGGLLPVLGGQWPAVLAVAAIFGVLHQGAGRNASFAAWATFVGLIYGGAYVYSQDLLVPAVAHSTANILSAALWKWEEGNQS